VVDSLVSILTPILALTATVISIAVGYGTIKQRRDEPTLQKWADMEEWQAHVNEALASDNQRLKRFEKHATAGADFEKVMLKAVRAMLTPLSEGNHGAEMKAMSTRIDEYLIER
jgi:hypothetical protein